MRPTYVESRHLQNLGSTSDSEMDCPNIRPLPLNSPLDLNLNMGDLRKLQVVFDTHPLIQAMQDQLNSPKVLDRDRPTRSSADELLQLMTAIKKSPVGDQRKAQDIIRDHLQDLIGTKGQPVLNAVSKRAEEMLATLSGAPTGPQSPQQNPNKGELVASVPLMSMVAALAQKMPEFRSILQKFSLEANFNLKVLEGNHVAAVDPRRSLTVRADLGDGARVNSTFTSCARANGTGISCSYQTAIDVESSVPLTEETEKNRPVRAAFNFRQETFANGRDSKTLKVELRIPLK